MKHSQDSLDIKSILSAISKEIDRVEKLKNEMFSSGKYNTDEFVRLSKQDKKIYRYYSFMTDNLYGQIDGVSRVFGYEPRCYNSWSAKVSELTNAKGEDK